MAEIDAYNEALSTGQYEKPGGLLGKYDNVRRFWEDEQLGVYLRPYLERLVDRKKACREGLRVLDLGCGSGDGYEFLTSIHSSRAPLAEHDSAIIRPDLLELYKGVDVNEGLLRQAQAVYRDQPKLAFTLSDINTHDIVSEQPYDLYLANYGTLSHNTDEQTLALLNNIARHGEKGALVVIDWVGRFSYEWQTLWTDDFDNNRCIDYAISYIYAGDEKKRDELTYFPLRLMGRLEAEGICRQVRKETGGAIALRKLADRSSFVGRHMDTAQYNRHCQPLRRLVNSLFEPNVCTNLDELIVRYVPAGGFDEVNAYHQRLADCWNHLVLSTMALMEKDTPPEAPMVIPGVTPRVFNTMKKVVKLAAGMREGNPRASLVEPQLGCCLRELEAGLQKGLGCGHGLAAIFEIVK